MRPGPGWGLRDLAVLAAEILARCRPDEPDQDPDKDFDDRSVTIQTTFQGAGVLHGDLTPECASIVGTVLDALGGLAGTGDERSKEQRYHDALQEAMRRLVAGGPAAGAGRAAGQGPGPHLPGRPGPPQRRPPP